MDILATALPCLCGLLLLSTLPTAAWVRRHREGRIIRAAQPFFLYGMLASSATILLSAVVASLGACESSRAGSLAICVSFPALFACGHAMSVSLLWPKAQRMRRILARPILRKLRISRRAVLKTFALLMGANAVLVGSWMGTSSPMVPAAGGGCLFPCERCNAAFAVLLAVLNVAASGVVVATAWNAQKETVARRDFRECRTILNASLVSAAAAVSAGPVLFGTAGLPRLERAALQCLFASAVGMGLLLAIFAPKLWIFFCTGEARRALMFSARVPGAPRADYSRRLAVIRKAHGPSADPDAPARAPPRRPQRPGSMRRDGAGLPFLELFAGPDVGAEAPAPEAGQGDAAAAVAQGDGAGGNGAE